MNVHTILEVVGAIYLVAVTLVLTAVGVMILAIRRDEKRLQRRRREWANNNRRNRPTMTTNQHTTTEEHALDAVRVWSRRIHGDGKRHTWCMQVARHQLWPTEFEQPLAGKGTAFTNASTAQTRIRTIGEIIDGVRRAER